MKPSSSYQQPILSSIHNEKIKRVLHLQKSHYRKKSDLFVVEGLKECSCAIQGNYTFIEILFCPEITPKEKITAMGVGEEKLVAVTKPLFEKIAYRKTTGGIIGIVTKKQHSLRQNFRKKCPLLLVVESIEKPGNLGALIRTADATGVDAMIVCDTLADIYNPNTIRSSVGCVFHVDIMLSNSKETIKWLYKRHINIYCTHLDSKKLYHTINYQLPCAIVVGKESTGVSDSWAQMTTNRIIIPMLGLGDSINVSAATAVVLYEAVRQRTSS